MSVTAHEKLEKSVISAIKRRDLVALKGIVQTDPELYKKTFNSIYVSNFTNKKLFAALCNTTPTIVDYAMISGMSLRIANTISETRTFKKLKNYDAFIAILKDPNVYLYDRTKIAIAISPTYHRLPQELKDLIEMRQIESRIADEISNLEHAKRIAQNAPARITDLRDQLQSKIDSTPDLSEAFLNSSTIPGKQAPTPSNAHIKNRLKV